MARYPGALPRFLGALKKADAVLASSDEAWQAIRPLTAAENDAVFEALRSRFRQGIVTDWSPADIAQADKLFALFGEVGGADLTGGARTIPAGTFWSGLTAR
jgi:NitT/TauT family transport system substrate-binding protein